VEFVASKTATNSTNFTKTITCDLHVIGFEMQFFRVSRPGY